MTSPSLWAGEIITGQVIKVADGDTLTIRTVDRQKIKVRLYGIDAPESDQPFGREARQALATMVDGKSVQVESMGNDRYRRLVGIVRVEGQDVGLALTQSGLAWVEKRHCKRASPCRGYWGAVRRAIKDHSGMWDGSAVPPWEWRRFDGVD